MPKPSVINRYPVQYLDLAKRFDDSPHTPIPIDLREPGETVDRDTLAKRAKSFQLELHGFRTALRKEGMIEEYPNFDHAEIGMLKDDSDLTIGVLIVDKDRTSTAEAVTKALNRLDDSSPPPAFTNEDES